MFPPRLGVSPLSVVRTTLPSSPVPCCHTIFRFRASSSGDLRPVRIPWLHRCQSTVSSTPSTPVPVQTSLHPLHDHSRYALQSVFSVDLTHSSSMPVVLSSPTPPLPTPSPNFPRPPTRRRLLYLALLTCPDPSRASRTDLWGYNRRIHTSFPSTVFPYPPTVPVLLRRSRPYLCLSGRVRVPLSVGRG